MDLPITILYDEGGFYEPHGGVSRYFTEIMRRLSDYGCEYRLTPISTSNAYLRASPFNLPPHKQSVHDFVRKYCAGRYFPGVGRLYRALARVFPCFFPSGELANLQAVSSALMRGDFDVYHPTAPHLVRREYCRIIGRKPMVVTVHDLIPELFNDNDLNGVCGSNRAAVLAAASKVIAVSENTKRDIMRLYGTPGDKIKVIHHGYLAPSPTFKHTVASFAGFSPYVIFVGKRSGYKNFAWTVKALAPLLKDGLRLVCTGKPFATEEKSLLAELGVLDRVTQKFLSDDELIAAYSEAVALIYPSLYEGFGLPILDAFAARCPVILTNASCFPEVAADAALYFDPGDDVALRQHVVSLQSDTKVRVSQIEKGTRRLADFSWDRCAAETVAVYQEVLR